MVNVFKNKRIIIVSSIILLLIVFGLIYYLQTSNSESSEISQNPTEKVTNIGSNIGKASETNPYEKTNPFDYKNPFE